MKTCATIIAVRYLVTAKVKPGKMEALDQAIEDLLGVLIGNDPDGNPGAGGIYDLI